MTDLPPDHAEQALADPFDDAVPTHGYQKMPMVGLGGSAGAIPALQAFFEAMPPDSGLAFAVIVHLSAEHESMLAELLQHSTAMRVVQVRETAEAEPNVVYVIPPGKALQTLDGHLRLADMVLKRGRHVAVDMFFRTLADSHGPHATAIVLSGSDGDGASGIKRIKECGGLTIVQDPALAEHSGMPSAAIATGMIDWILPVCDMPCRLIDYHRLEPRLKLPPEEGPQPGQVVAPAASTGSESVLRDVLTFLRMRTARDFSYYKRATILRRIARRMQVNGDRRAAGLPGLPAHPAGRTGGPAAGPADQRHQLLPRPRVLQGARGRAARPLPRQVGHGRGAVWMAASSRSVANTWTGVGESTARAHSLSRMATE